MPCNFAFIESIGVSEYYYATMRHRWYKLSTISNLIFSGLEWLCYETIKPKCTQHVPRLNRQKKNPIWTKQFRTWRHQAAEFEDTSGRTSGLSNKAESMARCGSFKKRHKTGTSNWRPYVSGVKKKKLNKIASSGFRLGVDSSGRQPTCAISTGYPMWMSDCGCRHAGLLGSDLNIFHQGKGFQGSVLIM
jgi:hypothetical protein